MEYLAQLGLMLGINEASKLLDNNKLFFNSTEAQRIANDILAAAEKKGSAYLNKAVNAIQSIPSLAGSPTIKDHITKARKLAHKSYQNIENKVNDMKSKASSVANEVIADANKSIVSKVWDDIKYGNKTKLFQGTRDAALNKYQQAMDNINKTDLSSVEKNI